MKIDTTAAEDVKGKELLAEVFEAAFEECAAEAASARHLLTVGAFVDYDVLWENLMKTIGVDV